MMFAVPNLEVKKWCDFGGNASKSGGTNESRPEDSFQDLTEFTREQVSRITNSIGQRMNIDEHSSLDAKHWYWTSLCAIKVSCTSFRYLLHSSRMLVDAFSRPMTGPLTPQIWDTLHFPTSFGRRIYRLFCWRNFRKTMHMASSRVKQASVVPPIWRVSPKRGFCLLPSFELPPHKSLHSHGSRQSDLRCCFDKNIPI